MSSILLATLVALLVQFTVSPIVFGAQRPTDVLSWSLLMGAFQGIPSFFIYLLMFAFFGATSPPETLALLMAVAIPAAVVIGYFAIIGPSLDFIRLKPMLTMGLMGSLSGTISYLALR